MIHDETTAKKIIEGVRNAVDAYFAHGKLMEAGVEEPNVWLKNCENPSRDKYDAGTSAVPGVQRARMVRHEVVVPGDEGGYYYALGWHDHHGDCWACRVYCEH